MISRQSKIIVLGWALVILSTTGTDAQNQKGWRGPTRDGIY